MNLPEIEAKLEKLPSEIASARVTYVKAQKEYKDAKDKLKTIKAKIRLEYKANHSEFTEKLLDAKVDELTEPDRLSVVNYEINATAKYLELQDLKELLQTTKWLCKAAMVDWQSTDSGRVIKKRSDL